MRLKLLFLILICAVFSQHALQAQTSPDSKWVAKTHLSTALAFAPDDSYIVTGGDNKELRFYNVGTGEVIDTIGIPGSPSQIKFTHDGKRMLVVIPEKLVLVFDAVTHELIKTIDMPGVNTIVGNISISFDDQYLTFGSTDSISIIDLTYYKTVKTIGYEKKEGQSSIYMGAQFTNDNLYVIVQGTRSFSNPNLDPENIFDVYDMQLNKTEPPFTFPSKSFRFSESGNYGVYYKLVNNVNDEKTGFYIWKYPGGNIERFIRTKYYASGDFSYGDRYFAFSEFINKEILIYDIQNNKLIKTLSTDEPRWLLGGINFANTSNLLLAVADLYLFLFKDDWLGIDENEYITNIQVFPQPSNSNFRIIFESSVDTRATVQITDLNGNKLLTLYDGNISTGKNEFTLDTGRFSSGSYFVVITENGRTISQQVILTK